MLFSVSQACLRTGEADGLFLRLVTAQSVDSVFIGGVDFVVFS